MNFQDPFERSQGPLSPGAKFARLMWLRLRTFPHAKDGSVAVIGTVIIVMLIMTGAFVTNLGLAYGAKQRNQIVADMANLAAGGTPSPIVRGAVSDMAVATATNVAEINGVKSAITTQAVPSPKGDGMVVLQTSLAEDVTLPFQILSKDKSITTKVGSWVAVSGGGSDCLTALKDTLYLANDVVVSGSKCNALAKTHLTLFKPAQMNVAAVKVGVGATEESWTLSGSVSPPASAFQYNFDVKDTFDPDPRVAALKSSVTSMGLNWPYGNDLPFRPQAPGSGSVTYANTTTSVPARTNFGTVTVRDSNLTFNGGGAADPSCTAATSVSGTLEFFGAVDLTFNSGCYVFTGTHLNPGANVKFRTAPGAQVTFFFYYGLNMEAGAKASFGDASYYFKGNKISTTDSNSLTFGSGTFTFYNCGISVSATSAVQFAGGKFYMYQNDILNAGQLVFGDGTFNYQGPGQVVLAKGSTTTYGNGDQKFYAYSFRDQGSDLTFGRRDTEATGSGTFLMSEAVFALQSKSFTSYGMTYGFSGGSVGFNFVGNMAAFAPTAPAPTAGYRDVLFAVWGSAVAFGQFGGVSGSLSGLIYVPWTRLTLQGDTHLKADDSGCLQFAAGDILIQHQTTLSLVPCGSFGGSGSTYTGQLLQ